MSCQLGLEKLSAVLAHLREPALGVSEETDAKRDCSLSVRMNIEAFYHSLADHSLSHPDLFSISGCHMLYKPHRIAQIIN